VNKRAELLRNIVTEVVGYNGALEGYEAHIFDEEFFDVYFSEKMEIARAVFFGNIESWSDDYIRFNGYGNLESLSDWAYEAELLEGEKEIVSEAEDLLEENSDNDYLKGLLDELKELDKEEDNE
jgi:hypothetical protein